MTLSNENLERFSANYHAGMEALHGRNLERAQTRLGDALGIAREDGALREESNAVVPYAKALWLAGDFGRSRDQLGYSLERVQPVQNLQDEAGAILTGLGRCAAARIAHDVRNRTAQAVEWRENALPYFLRANNLLADHPHLYYAFANDLWGGTVAALAHDRRFARRLLDHGRQIQDRRSSGYDDRTPAEISPRGVKLLKAAHFLLPLGNKTPILAAGVRRALAS